MQIFECKAYPEYKIVAYSYETRYSWGHKAELIKNNDCTLNTYKIRYYNRTWERYQYQSVIKSVLDDYINRLKSTQQEEFIRQEKTNPTIEKLETFYKEL